MKKKGQTAKWRTCNSFTTNTRRHKEFRLFVPALKMGSEVSPGLARHLCLRQVQAGQADFGVILVSPTSGDVGLRFHPTW